MSSLFVASRAILRRMKTDALDPALVVIVCMRDEVASEFADDEHGVCRLCGVAVHHRPHIPRPSQLICLACFAAHTDDDDQIAVTAETFCEVNVWLGTVLPLDEADRFAPDICQVCGKVVGYGIRALHLGRCEAHLGTDRDRGRTRRA
jgi:hypothetical protein